MVVIRLSGFIRVKMVVFGQSGCIQKKWLYLGKVVVFGQKRLYSGKSACIRARWLCSGKMVAMGQKRL